MGIKGPYEEFLETVLCYPRFDRATYSRRLKELDELGIDRLLSKGPGSIGRWKVLGKGHTGVVVVAERAKRDAALKILRTDAARGSLEREAGLLSYANSIGVGPQLVRSSVGMTVSELIEGRPIRSWMDSAHVKPNFDRCIHSLLFQGFRLDFAGLDHGELSRADRHVIVQSDENPVILDFEGAGIYRRCNNLPSLIQYLFIRNESLRTKFSENDPFILPRLLKSLRNYKEEITIESYRQVMGQLGLE